jgi:A/G-specific adenine glycosylase
MKGLREELLLWHKGNNRSFPWRIELDPYKIMIAEFMLQRTRAEQVVPVYYKFMDKYPDITTLSSSNIEELREVLKPLGLYWRTEHFQKAALYIIDKYCGTIPSNRDELLDIPGVGEYVAGAILAVAFSKRAPIIDSNIARVLNRIYGLELKGEIRRKKQIVELSTDLFDYYNPKEILFSIIDLSASICTPTNPKHDICPLKTRCKYYKTVHKKED